LSHPEASSLSRSLFEALADFANLGHTSEDLEEFRLKHPNFFSFYATDSYLRAFEAFSRTWRPDIRQLVRDWLQSEEGKRGPDPSLLRYQSFLRRVWSSNDPTGECLWALFGFRPQGIEIGQPFPAMPSANGVNGQLSLVFASEFQQSVYELMQCRWRAKICPQCGRFFVASKTAQVSCSEECARVAKNRRALDYWRREGKARRKERSESMKKKRT
jgi:hypothetical protein